MSNSIELVDPAFVDFLETPLSKMLPSDMNNEIKIQLTEQYSIESGYILTRNQFEVLSQSMITKAKEDSGLWTLTFYPKSGDIVEGSIFNKYVYPTLYLSPDFEYYRWIYGPRLAKDWVRFYDRIQNAEYTRS